MTSVTEPVTTDLRRLYGYLSARRRFQMVVLILLMLVGTIAEHLGVRAACALGGGAGLVAVAALVLIGRRAGLAWSYGRDL